MFHYFKLPARLNAVDCNGELALNIALHLRHDALATCLVQHGASVDCADQDGRRLLHKAIHRRMFLSFPNFQRRLNLTFRFFVFCSVECFRLDDAFSCQFLLKNGALPSVVEQHSGCSPLHLLATWKSQEVEEIAKLLLDKGSDPNVVADDGRYIIIAIEFSF